MKTRISKVLIFFFTFYSCDVKENVISYSIDNNFTKGILTENDLSIDEILLLHRNQKEIDVQIFILSNLDLNELDEIYFTFNNQRYPLEYFDEIQNEGYNSKKVLITNNVLRQNLLESVNKKKFKLFIDNVQFFYSRNNIVRRIYFTNKSKAYYTQLGPSF